jgi:hypothetical protein
MAKEKKSARELEAVILDRSLQAGMALQSRDEGLILRALRLAGSSADAGVGKSWSNSIRWRARGSEI